MHQNLARAELKWGETFEYLGQLDDSCKHYQRALQLSEELNWIPGKVLSLAYLGLTKWWLGDFDVGISSLQRAYRLACEIGHKSHLYYIARFMGQVYLDRLELVRAWPYFQESQQYAKDLGILDIGTLFYMGIYHIRKRNLDEATGCFESILAVRQRYEELDITGASLCYLGKLLQLKGDYSGAEKQCREGLGIVRQTGYRLLLGPALGITGEVLMALRSYDEAGVHLREQLQVAVDGHVKVHEVMACINLGHLSLALKKANEAKNDFDRALELSRALHADEPVNIIHMEMGH